MKLRCNDNAELLSESFCITDKQAQKIADMMTALDGSIRYSQLAQRIVEEAGLTKKEQLVYVGIVLGLRLFPILEDENKTHEK